MELFIAVIAFIAFSVITDVIEGKKKKNRPIPQPQPRQREEPRTEIKVKKPKPVVIPEIKRQPQEETINPYIGAVKSTSVVKKAAASAKPSEISSAAESLPMHSDKGKLQPADIHSDVLIHAVAYAQILQPPKAYQYMATRSCRGDWQNNK